MIETMKVSVTTPIATPKIVRDERSLFALTVATAIAADSLMSSKDIRTLQLLRTQSLDGVEARSLPSGPEAAGDADGRGDTDAQNRRGRAEEEREAHQLREQEGECEARAHA